MTTEYSSHSTSHISQCRIIELPRHTHANGSLTAVEDYANGLPFAIRRVFYLFDVPADAARGGHSHHQAHELIVALSGSFDVHLSDGHRSATFTLSRPYHGLYIPPGIWRTLDNFTSGAICCVITSEEYSESDYVRSHEKFLEITSTKTLK